jgi:hypothetical protein
MLNDIKVGVKIFSEASFPIIGNASRKNFLLKKNLTMYSSEWTEGLMNSKCPTDNLGCKGRRYILYEYFIVGVK